MSHVDELSSARLVVAMADPAREHVGIDCRPELQRFVDRVDDVMQKIFFIRVVSPSPGVYHPVRCTSGENARAGSSEVTEQMAAGLAVTGRSPVGYPLVHREVVGA